MYLMCCVYKLTLRRPDCHPAGAIAVANAASLTIGNATTFVENTADSNGGEHRIMRQCHTEAYEGNAAQSGIVFTRATRQYSQKTVDGSILRSDTTTLTLHAVLSWQIPRLSEPGTCVRSLSNGSPECDTSRGSLSSIFSSFLQPRFLLFAGVVHVVDSTFATEQETFFYGNTAVRGAGGGIYCSKAVATFNGSSFTENSAFGVEASTWRALEGNVASAWTSACQNSLKIPTPDERF